jgi:hypothetical protein
MQAMKQLHGSQTRHGAVIAKVHLSDGFDEKMVSLIFKGLQFIKTAVPLLSFLGRKNCLSRTGGSRVMRCANER